MSGKIDQFCDDLKHRLNSIEDLKHRLNSIEAKILKVKESVETAPKEGAATVKSKLADLKSALHAKKEEVEVAKAKMEERIKAKKTEVETQIAEKKAQRQKEKLIRKAERTEDYAGAAIVFALAAIEEAEIAVLEAVEARMAAEAVAAE